MYHNDYICHHTDQCVFVWAPALLYHTLHKYVWVTERRFSIAAAEQTFIEVSETDNRGEGFSAWNENTRAGACVHLLWAIIDSHCVVILNLIIFSPDKRLHGVYSGGEMDSSTAVITEQECYQLHVNDSVLHNHAHTQTHSNEMNMFLFEPRMIWSHSSIVYIYITIQQLVCIAGLKMCLCLQFL